MRKALPVILLLMGLLVAVTPLRVTADARAAVAPQGYELTSAYPNPFSHTTTFTLTVAERQHVLVEVYNMLGHRLAVLYDGPMEDNETRTLTFEAGNLPRGIYLYRATGRDFVATGQVTLMR